MKNNWVITQLNTNIPAPCVSEGLYDAVREAVGAVEDNNKYILYEVTKMHKHTKEAIAD